MRQIASLFVMSVLAGIALTPSPVYGQSFGGIVGSVTDSGGAVIPGATLTAADKNTGFARTVTTASDGVYSLPRLPVGTYTITASA